MKIKKDLVKETEQLLKGPDELLALNLLEMAYKNGKEPNTITDDFLTIYSKLKKRDEKNET